MSADFEEIDRRATPIGEISVRRRREPTLEVDVYEVKLGDEFLMSSLFSVAETELAALALDEVAGDGLDVVVGGLGLGYTARAALADPRVRSLHVIEALDAVIDWHEQSLLPLSTELTSDDRCRFVHGDFFAMVERDEGFAADGNLDRCDAVLLDIDHSPRNLLAPSHADFYEPSGLSRLATRLLPGGVFGLWSDDPPDDTFIAALDQVFASSDAHEVTFPNFYTGDDSRATVYVAATPDR